MQYPAVQGEQPNYMHSGLPPNAQIIHQHTTYNEQSGAMYPQHGFVQEQYQTAQVAHMVQAPQQAQYHVVEHHVPSTVSIERRNYTTTTTYQVPGESQSTAKFSSSRAGRIEAPKQFAVQEEYQEEIPIQQPGYTELHYVEQQQPLQMQFIGQAQTSCAVQQPMTQFQCEVEQPAPQVQYMEIQTQAPVQNSQYVIQQQPQVQTQYVMQQQPQVQTQYVMQQQPQVQTQYVTQQQPQVQTQYVTQQQPQVQTQYVMQQQPQVQTEYVMQQQQQLYQYVEVEGPPQYVEVPSPKQYVEVPQPPKLVEIPQPSVRVEIDSPSQIVCVPSPCHLVQVPVGQVATSFVSQSQVGVKPGGSPVVSTLEVASPSSGSSRVSYHVPPQSHGTSSLPVRVETSDVRSSNTAQHGQTTSTHTSSTSSVSHTNSVTGVKVSTGSEVKTGAVQNHVERTSNNKESDDKSSMQVRSRALPDETSFPLAEHSNPRVEAHAAVDSNENQAKSYTPPRSPRLRNRVRLLIPFDTKQRELIKRLDIGDRCRIGQALREDVATHFAALVPVDTATIMAPMEFNKDGAITVAFDISPSLPEARKDEIQARGTVSVNLSKAKVALSEFDL